MIHLTYIQKLFGAELSDFFLKKQIKESRMSSYIWNPNKQQIILSISMSHEILSNPNLGVLHIFHSVKSS